MVNSKNNSRFDGSIFYSYLSIFSISLLVLLLLSSAIFFGQAGVLDNSVILFENPLKPRYLYLFTYIASTFILYSMLTGSISISKINGGINHTSLHRGFAGPMAIFGCLHLAWFAFIDSDPTTDRFFVLRMNVVVLTIFVHVILLVMNDMRIVISCVRFVVMMTCLINVLVVAVPDLFIFKMGAASGRAAGLFWDPNECATIIAMSLPLINAGRSQSIRFIQSLIVLIGVALTFSRAGIALWIVAVLFGEILRPGDKTVSWRKILSDTIPTAIIIFIGAILIVAFWADFVEVMRPYLNSDTYSRLTGSDEGTTSERLQVLVLGIEQFYSNWIVGAGYASTHVWSFHVSVHNMIVIIMAELGLIGLAWYLFFLYRVFTMPLRFGLIFGILLLVISAFTHSWFDMYYYMLLTQLYWRYSTISAAN